MVGGFHPVPLPHLFLDSQKSLGADLGGGGGGGRGGQGAGHRGGGAEEVVAPEEVWLVSRTDNDGAASRFCRSSPSLIRRYASGGLAAQTQNSAWTQRVNKRALMAPPPPRLGGLGWAGGGDNRWGRLCPGGTPGLAAGLLVLLPILCTRPSHAGVDGSPLWATKWRGRLESFRPGSYSSALQGRWRLHKPVRGEG